MKKMQKPMISKFAERIPFGCDNFISFLLHTSKFSTGILLLVVPLGIRAPVADFLGTISPRDSDSLER